MAITETKPLKQLRELLHEQQEPFTLNTHLLQRGYSRKSSNSESTCCFHGNSSKSLKRSVRCGLNTIKKPQHSRVLKAVLNQAISIKRRLRINGSNHNDEEIKVSEKSRNDQQVPELDRFSSASSATVFNSFSESEVEEMSTSSQNDILLTTNITQLLNLHSPQEVSADRMLQQQCIEESRQLSPASVLEQIPSNGNSPIHSNNTEDSSTTEEENASKSRVMLPEKFTEDCILSASLWDVLFYPPNEKPVCGKATRTQEFVKSYFSPQYLKSKMVLQQTKQLLFDYVKEIVETQEREGKLQCHHQQFLGPEELGKVIGEKIKSWDKQSDNESNLIKLLNLDLPSSEQSWSNYKPDRRDKGLAVEDAFLDLLDSEQDWKEYEPQRRETGSEIGDIILEELVNDIVRNMIGFSSSITRCYA
ncbi:hypothetical protein SADUNF_Sadunf14G0005000 [Salix dunnii]|uniref:DUF4378 domain-containing protein n=1 Tax=Salix dunnii TaxID=1413687 RepID=A0A835MPD4_9ROSI|nr:hypothetical protein SADUNF_Sadunf14G0005000 [Salix dunnii]